MNFFESNLDFFRKNNKILYEAITLQQSNYDTTIENVENNRNCLVENKNTRCFIHSIYNINREIEETFKEVDKSVDTLIIFGFGFGHSMKYIYENFKNLENIIIIEPDLNLYKKILEELSIYEFKNYLRNVSISFIINQNKEVAFELLNCQIEKSKKNNLGVVYNLAYRSLYKGYFEYISEEIVKNIRRKVVNIATLDYGKKIWTINIFGNLRVKPQGKISSYFDKYKDKTAILVSAGPSLNKNIHLLKDVGNKAIIMAAGSSIKILHNNGIVPHFRFAMDGWETETNVFQGVDKNISTLVYSNKLNRKILPDYSGEKINMVLDSEALTKYVYNKANINFSEIRSGFSISNMVLDIILKMGFKAVVFMGQDLCYTGGELHAKGSWNEAKLNFEEGYEKAKDIYGNEVYTQKAFLSMKYAFELFVKSNPHMKYINATEGGLGLEGVENKKFIEVLEVLNENDNVEDIKQTVIHDNDISNYDEKIYNVILEIEKDIKKINNINENRFKKLKKINKFKEKKIGINKLLSELYYMDNFEKALDDIEFYKKVVKPILMSTYNSIKMSFRYIGEDKNKLAESLEKILLGFTAELDDYLSVLIMLVNDFKKVEE